MITASAWEGLGQVLLSDKGFGNGIRETVKVSALRGGFGQVPLSDKWLGRLVFGKSMRCLLRKGALGQYFF